jgi:hypothetical protein
MIDKNKLENVEYISYWLRMVTKDNTCIYEINSGIAMVKPNSAKNGPHSPKNWALIYGRNNKMLRLEHSPV